MDKKVRRFKGTACLIIIFFCFGGYAAFAGKDHVSNPAPPKAVREIKVDLKKKEKTILYVAKRTFEECMAEETKLCNQKAKGTRQDCIDRARIRCNKETGN